jgi:hypothetical protein
VSVLIRRITLAALLAALVGGSLAIPASSKTGPVASASKCKKAKKGKHRKKKKKCGSSRPSGSTLPGQATHATPTQPSSPATPPQSRTMSAIAVTDNPILGGRSTSGQVTISGVAPSGGQPVTLQNTNPADVSVPASVVVPSGQTTAGFLVGTTDGSHVTATLTASIGNSNATTQLQVVDTPSVSSLALQRQCFTGPGSFDSNRVTLDVPAAADTPVGLSSDSLSFMVPSSVIVQAGSKSALFSALAGVGPASVTVTATLGSSPPVTDTASVSPTTPVPAVSDLALNPSNVTVGGSSIGTVTLDCEALGPSGSTVTLSSDNPSVATVQPNVVVSQDQLTATFSITTVGVGTAHITATGPSGPGAQRTIQVDSQPD